MFMIDGIGTATPPHVISQDDAAHIAQTLCGECAPCSVPEARQKVQSLYANAGVRTRHSVLLHSSTNGESARQTFYAPARSPNDGGPTTQARMRQFERAAGPLAVKACSAAFRNAGHSPAKVTHLITVSCSGFAAPGFDLTIIGELGLPADTQRTHVGFMGCHGAVNALRVGQAFAAGNSQACVLICAVELCSLHHQYGDRVDQIVANALFADGAAAVVGRSVSPAHGQPRWCVLGTGSTIIPNTEDYMAWHIRDHGFQMSLSPLVPAVIKQTLRPWLQKWLSQYGFTISDINSWAIHPGGPKILQACAVALGLPHDRLRASEEVLSECGNMSSPTILFILERLQVQVARPPCVMLAFGPGLAIEAALLVG